MSTPLSLDVVLSSLSQSYRKVFIYVLWGGGGVKKSFSLGLGYCYYNINMSHDLVLEMTII